MSLGRFEKGSPGNTGGRSSSAGGVAQPGIASRKGSQGGLDSQNHAQDSDDEIGDVTASWREGGDARVPKATQPTVTKPNRRRKENRPQLLFWLPLSFSAFVSGGTWIKPFRSSRISPGLHPHSGQAPSKLGRSDPHLGQRFCDIVPSTATLGACLFQIGIRRLRSFPDHSRDKSLWACPAQSVCPPDLPEESLPLSLFHQ